MPRQTVAVIIPTKNVAAFFRPTLESIRFADEVIVVDMSSTDGTTSLCTEYANVKVIDKVDYIYANVNTGFDAATTDWVIRLDSDEVLTAALQDEILSFLENPPANVNTNGRRKTRSGSFTKG
jgi:glycosyltransferase involved in cell wall biosynthesis